MHIPVLSKEIAELVKIPKDGILVDGTLGNGGHSLVIADTTKNPITIVGIDKDGNALKRAEENLKTLRGKNIFRKGNFKNLNKILQEEKIEAVDGIILDLGFSSDQLENSGRGFSFQKEEPLVMTLSDTPENEDLTAYDIVNSWEKENLELIIRTYGEEKRARKIAEAIVEARKKRKIETSKELSDIIGNTMGKNGRINPATKTFQAIRIAVNNEIENLTKTLPEAFSALKKGGLMAIISFHSLEDRVVKRFFKEKKDRGEAELITKKPITPSQNEMTENPRSRSAKLRILRKI